MNYVQGSANDFLFNFHFFGPEAQPFQGEMEEEIICNRREDLADNNVGSFKRKRQREPTYYSASVVFNLRLHDDFPVIFLWAPQGPALPEPQEVQENLHDLWTSSLELSNKEEKKRAPVAHQGPEDVLS